MKNLCFWLIMVGLALSSCKFELKTNDSASPQTAQNSNTVPAGNTGPEEQDKDAKSLPNVFGNEETETSPPTGPSSCTNVILPDKEVLAKQTFPIDFEPFGNSCFVTGYNPEFDDPPLDSEYFIYKNGREIYRFPNQFNGVTVGCWVTAVAFEDLNNDGLTDVIVAGMCSAKSAPYPSNMVYTNTGQDFYTDEEANYTLDKFKKIKDIADFVKKNKQIFFP